MTIQAVAPRVRDGAIWAAAWPVLAVFVLSNAATPLYVVWQREMGFSSGTLTLVFASYIAGLLGALTVAGVVSDRVGRKPVLLPAIVLAMVACVLFACAGSVLVLALARLLTGIAVGCAVSAGMAAVTDIAGRGRTAKGALAASVAMALGAGLGPLLSGVLSELAPGATVTVFVVEIVLLAVAFVVVLRMDLPSGTGGRGPWIRLPAVPAQGRTAVLFGIAAFAPGITATSFVLSLGPSVLGLLGSANRVVAGGTAFVMFLAATGIQFAVRHRGVRAILVGSSVATTASTVALAGAVATASVPVFGVAAVLAGMGQGLGQLGGLTAIGSTVPADRLAEANAAQNVGGYLPAAVLPLTAGFLGDATGLATATKVFAAVVAIAALVGATFALRRGTEVERVVGQG
ncbi:MFS transporter [Nocardia sp. Root136]|uniref:MFS transporter n=1 Tax=Nocardia sp. Root136 TaxID=1736458 RepID=UPI0006FD6692|nr:MFS transporter [Nocardia sp. Root136]KQY28001.1 MFS transporter [Nocardia sp. Root136]